MAWDTEILFSNIVLVGSFNPAIFSPAWLAKNDVISEDEANAAEEPVTHPQVAQISIEHLTITVETNKFMVRYASDPAVRSLDIVVQIFKDLLPHTPISAFGINYGEHWRTETPQQRLALGRALAPLEPWGEWGATFDDDDPQMVGGMSALVMKKPFSPKGTGENILTGYRRAEISPSTEIPDQLRAVLVGTNHHREFVVDTARGALPAIELAIEEFDGAIMAAKKIIQQIKDFAKGMPT